MFRSAVGPSALMRLSWVVVFLLCTGCCRVGFGRLEPFSADEYATHVRAQQREFGSAFTVLAVPPFVVIGDGPRAWVQQDAKEVVQVASNLLKAHFFRRDPAEIINIFMLQTDASYDVYAGSVAGSPSTPYGFYSPCRRAIYSNMSLGNGTLVHEMVHAFMEANFPASPIWFNEGLGSLYEHTDLDSGELRGRINWRLPELKKAIQNGKTIPFEELFSKGRVAFYVEKNRGLYYAMARYLLYYLQEQGLLETYYQQFVANQGADPTGLMTLAKVISEKDLRAFQAKWERFVLALPDP